MKGKPMNSSDENRPSSSDSGRRLFLKAGIALAPVVITLHARPASAQSSHPYAEVAYRYGNPDNLGKFHNSLDPNGPPLDVPVSQQSAKSDKTTKSKKRRRG